MSDKVKRTHRELARHAAEIADCFFDGAKVTILVRNPHIAEADMVVSDDEMEQVVEAIKKLQLKEVMTLA